MKYILFWFIYILVVMLVSTLFAVGFEALLNLFRRGKE